ncbi:GNAT family N-acetyltransferase [Bailinhaonella thermotolerans]|uniref:GNAT family N-acetyltransferase n=1 Tax=Bailinhaonella thermotolerans TaxID=1070861 RepID=A0A3A4BB49_9ACTN|nr:GNAT family N-acetyltransferase [Bailinhaonella thermotolerans]RJL35306.1 GNAT family N-acetyltransferase [Bailinhaonella thermotolerans]
MRELSYLGEVRAACGDDILVMWVAQGMRPGVRAFAHGDAVAVACPDVSCRDRLAVRGPVRDAAPLVRHALTEMGPTYRPIGEAGLIRALPERVPGLRFAAQFSLMRTAAAPPRQAAEHDVRWLEPAEEVRVKELLAQAFPASYARPGVSGVRRWAGAEDGQGRLAAVTADAWSAPGTGFIAGVATAPRARGRGYAAAVFGFVLADLVAAHGRAALLVDDDNPRAIALYARLGLSRHPVAAAKLAP